MNDTQALTTIVESSPIELAIAGWLHTHEKSVRTHKAYADTLKQFRKALTRIGKDLDADVQTLMLVAQSFASASQQKARASDATQNTRLAILCSFFDYAIERHLLLPMDDKGYVMNPIKVVDRAKVEPYHSIKWLEEQEVMQRLSQIDRSTLEGKRDYILLHILFYTGRRAQEIASLRWKHVHQGEHITLTFEHCKGDKTMRDELPSSYGKALLSWLQAYYGSVECLDPETPLWASLTVNTDLQGKALGVRAIERLCIKHLQTHATATVLSTTISAATTAATETGRQCKGQDCSCIASTCRTLADCRIRVRILHLERSHHMATIEEMITQLQHEVTVLQDRDRDHDHHITLLLGQLLKIVPELTDIKVTLAEHTERFDRIDARFDALNEHLNNHTSQLALILQKLDEKK